MVTGRSLKRQTIASEKCESAEAFGQHVQHEHKVARALRARECIEITDVTGWTRYCPRSREMV